MTSVYEDHNQAVEIDPAAESATPVASFSEKQPHPGSDSPNKVVVWLEYKYFGMDEFEYPF